MLSRFTPVPCPPDLPFRLVPSSPSNHHHPRNHLPLQHPPQLSINQDSPSSSSMPPIRSPGMVKGVASLRSGAQTANPKAGGRKFAHFNHLEEGGNRVDGKGELNFTLRERRWEMGGERRRTGVDVELRRFVRPLSSLPLPNRYTRMLIHSSLTSCSSSDRRLQGETETTFCETSSPSERGEGPLQEGERGAGVLQEEVSRALSPLVLYQRLELIYVFALVLYYQSWV